MVLKNLKGEKEYLMFIVYVDLNAFFIDLNRCTQNCSMFSVHIQKICLSSIEFVYISPRICSTVLFINKEISWCVFLVSLKYLFVCSTIIFDT